MIREQTILLKIWYDDSATKAPIEWDWPNLLDMGYHMDDSEGVQILEVDGKAVQEWKPWIDR